VRDQAGEEDTLLALQSDTEAHYGRLENARGLSRRAVQAAERAGAPEAAAGWLVNAALREAEFGNAARARQDVLEALRLSGGRDVLALGGLASARAGDAARAEGFVRDLERHNSRNTVLHRYWLPVIRAAIAIDQRRPSDALAALDAAQPYEVASPPPIGLASLYPIYLRGEALLLRRDGVAAAGEFQKILDRPGLVLNHPLHALAWLNLARARALSLDAPGARHAYQDFFSAWKGADPDAILLGRARTEYARLR
jgi:tetratricopeptide (TPR) repeat protein